ncbi:lysophospholipase [Epithele typhae]|uniref:lysophospholipase n=1 Tax=Epithele typhae TaxID=378194 RepID=UPI002007AAF6|nr:lysophospholipase [Epithele typhae]KAH9935223.1 lysophospholipase [Epithele typhae]
MASTTSASRLQTFTEEWLPGWDGLNFYTRTYTPADGAPRAVVLFVHGFAEYIGRYEWAHGVYATRGIAVVAFDQRGFGLTAMGDSAHVSKASKYGKTSWRNQFADIDWWLRHVRDRFPGVPVFLMGHSMGGGLSLGFATRTSPPPAPDGVAHLSGVIASSPLILLTHPSSRILRFLGWLASFVLPSFVIPAPVNPDHLSHDLAINAANAKDPLCPQSGSVKGVNDMLNGGEELFRNSYKNWPKELPLYMVHGTGDEVTSCKASEEFCEKVVADDKTFVPVEGGFHELANETPGGMKDRYVDGCIAWILEHVETTPLTQL